MRPAKRGRQLAVAVGLALLVAGAFAGTLHLRSPSETGDAVAAVADGTAAPDPVAIDTDPDATAAPVPLSDLDDAEPEPEPTLPADADGAPGDAEAIDRSPDDPSSYVSRAGMPAPLHPDCLGMMSLCLGDDLALAVNRLGEPIESFAGDDALEHHYWELDGVAVSVLTDLGDAIVSVGVYISDDTEVGAPDGVVVGRTTTGELIERLGVGVTDIWGGEGIIALELATDTHPERGHRSGGINARLDEPLGEQLLGVGDDVSRAAVIARDVAVTRWTVATGSRDEMSDASLAATDTAGALPRGRSGEAPPWAHDAVESARDGYEIWDDRSWNPDATLNVVIGGMKGSATGRGVHAFFFVDGEGYIGTDLWAPSNTITVVAAEDTVITLDYRLYYADDAGCCPTAGSAAVRFRWNGEKLEPLDPIPPLSTEGSPHR